MTTVQLSWFDDLCNKVNSWLQGDIFAWISNWFSDAMNTLKSLWNDAISSVLERFAHYVLDGILEFIFARFYAVLTTILLVLDCIEDCFDVVSGISPVYRMVNGEYKPMTLLSALFQESSVQRMMAAMIGIGMVLCMFCAILATIKSTMEMDGSRSKPVGHVLRVTAKAMLYFILIPLMAGFMLSLSGVILNTIDNAFTGGNGKTTVARTIFTVATLDAIDTDKHPEAKSYNASYQGEKPDDFGVMDKYRRDFYLVDEEDMLPNYANPFRVKETFSFRGIDYVIGFGMGIYFNIVLGMVMFIFICRIFEVIVLLITEPFFIAMMPLDDGEHFKSWSDLFMGKLFGGYGMVVAMRLYLMVAGMLFSNTISFVRPGSTGAAVQNYLIKLLFLAGGAMGIRTIGPLVTSILSQSAARAEQEEASIGARYGGMVASFQGRRVGKLLTASGSIAGGIASSGIGLAAFGASKAVEKVKSGVTQVFKGRGSSSAQGNNNSNQYNGGVPKNLPPAAVGSKPNNQLIEVKQLADKGNNINNINNINNGNNGNNGPAAAKGDNKAPGAANTAGKGANGRDIRDVLGVGNGNIAQNNGNNFNNQGGNRFDGK